MSKTYVDVYASDYTRAVDSCNSFTKTGNYCRTENEITNQSADWTEGRSGKDRCKSICTQNVSGIRGSGKNPCKGGPVDAYNRKFQSRSDNSKFEDVGMECTWYVGSEDLRNMSDDTRYTSSSMLDNNNRRVSLFEQLLFGIRSGNYNTTADGYCNKLQNLRKVIDKQGRTCFDKIESDISSAEANRMAREMCSMNAFLPECACINISKGTEYCLANPALPGCDKVVNAYNKYPENAKTQFNLKSFTPMCFAPEVCAGNDIVEPRTLPSPCNQTITVCDQTINFGDVSGGTVNLEQEMQCEARSYAVEAPASAPAPAPAPASAPAPSSAATPTPGDDEDEPFLTYNQQVIGGTGIALSSLSSCILLVVILMFMM